MTHISTLHNNIYTHNTYTYVPPQNSQVYGDEKDGIVNLERHSTSIVEMKGDMHMLCLGDLNARIGDRHDFILIDDTTYLPIDDDYNVDVFSVRKASKDNEVNTFGKSLLKMCCNLNIHVLNGRCTSDQQGEFTYMSTIEVRVLLTSV
jgi:hypothetical protein